MHSIWFWLKWELFFAITLPLAWRLAKWVYNWKRKSNPLS